jgi:hypothetical protein
MESNALKSMSIDDLWNLYEQLASTLAHKIVAEKATLEERLRKRRPRKPSAPPRSSSPFPSCIPRARSPDKSRSAIAIAGRRWDCRRCAIVSGMKIIKVCIDK